MINARDFKTIGYRFISPDFSGEPQVGDNLENSNVWDGDEPTDYELGGTCAFSTLGECEKYATWSEGWIVMIGGESEGYGELKGELLIGDALVLSVAKWQ
tara:strand:+ start:32 stop:331 length:300 start_codon:yes stop_codon:yes gene_type:complete